MFENSKLGQRIIAKLSLPVRSTHGEDLVTISKTRYANPWYKSLGLLVHRELLLWWRDKYMIKAKLVQSKWR
jgi:hypothetical protein